MRLTRPRPPARLLDEDAAGTFEPAPEVEEWARAVFVDPGGPYYDEDHEHLEDAKIGVLWTNTLNMRRGVVVAGDAQMPMRTAGRLGGWEKEVYLWNLRRWFGTDEIHFLLRFSAAACDEYDDLSFSAIVKHELCHCAQALDRGGQKWFRENGSRVFTMAPHDVEQFVSVVRDFGPVGRNTPEFIEAARQRPRFGEAQVRVACGNCLAKAA